MAFAQQLVASSRPEASNSLSERPAAAAGGVASGDESVSASGASGGTEIVLASEQPQAPVVQAPAAEGLLSSLERWLKGVGERK